MTQEFEFIVDEEGRELCEEIISEMLRLFGFSRHEAVGRLNRLWRGNDFEGPDDIRYHETPEFWARDISYGHNSFWWTNPPDLKPLPYP